MFPDLILNLPEDSRIMVFTKPKGGSESGFGGIVYLSVAPDGHLSGLRIFSGSSGCNSLSSSLTKSQLNSGRLLHWDRNTVTSKAAAFS